MKGFVAFCSLLFLAASAGAEAEKQSSRYGQLKVGGMVRIQVLGVGRIEGRYEGESASGVRLRTRDDSQEIPHESIRAVWRRGRSTGTGALALGLTAGVGLGFLASSFEEGMTGQSDGGTFLAAAAIGGIPGSLLGALIGAAIPKWRQVYSAEEAARWSPATRRPQAYALGLGGYAQESARALESGPTVGSGVFLLGFARSTDAGAPAGSVGGTATLLASVGANLGLGVDLGYHKLGTGEIVRPNGSTGDYSERVWHAGVAARWIRASGTIRPYGIVGLGFYSWDGLHYQQSVYGVNFTGLSVGGGFQYRPDRSPFALTVEGRWHGSIKQLNEAGAEDRDHRMLSLTAGTSVRW